ncbi:MAG: DeoR/GlpR transcriptional regulator [Erysipelotrichaceae bacterium]|nr:DeoR/GlpR transcriptional regulator [Erysipelotrichaceae bacterium]
MKVSKDLVDKRRQEVMKLIQENNFMSVEELLKHFNVSPATLRRDLQYWESLGAIERNYGGAALLQAFIEEDEETYQRRRYMKAIAKRAAMFVEDGDIIFINSSMTATMLIEYIKYKHVTIITNNAKAINYNPDENVTILFTGGELRFPKRSMTGDLALQTINSITANKCFIGCSGLTTEGISTANVKETMVNKTMLQRTKGKRFVLCDHTKVGLNFAFRYATFDGIDYLISDVDADNDILSYIKKHNDITIIREEPLQK